MGVNFVFLFGAIHMRLYIHLSDDNAAKSVKELSMRFIKIRNCYENIFFCVIARAVVITQNILSECAVLFFCCTQLYSK